MPKFFLTWEIDIDAENHIEAARKAMYFMQQPDTLATVFHVQKEDAEVGIKIDLTELDDSNDDMQRAFSAGWQMRYAGDPTEDLASRVSGPVLYHPEHDRVWPPSDPEGAYRDLGLDDDDFCRTCNCLYDGCGDGYDGECPDCADKAEEKGAEIAARAAGWLHGGDGDGIIYHGDHYDSWKEAVSYSGGEGYEDAPIYSTWQECCDFEGIEYEPAGDDA